MGIRFFCPNGHKLNVKEHLAGKAGFCPECGVRLVVPLQSTRKSSKELAAGIAGSENPLKNPSGSQKPLSLQKPSKPQNLCKPQESRQNSYQESFLELPRESEKQSTSIPMLVLEEDCTPSAPASKSVSDSVNPILQDTSVIWYIQVLNGPQYGPITGDVVRSWIREHRIEPTMLVWREGWANWLEAKNVFPELENAIE
jgi:hypothetical protein